MLSFRAATVVSANTNDSYRCNNPCLEHSTGIYRRSSHPGIYRGIPPWHLQRNSTLASTEEAPTLASTEEFHPGIYTGSSHPGIYRGIPPWHLQRKLPPWHLQRNSTLASTQEAPTLASTQEAPTLASTDEAPTLASTQEAPTLASLHWMLLSFFPGTIHTNHRISPSFHKLYFCCLGKHSQTETSFEMNFLSPFLCIAQTKLS